MTGNFLKSGFKFENGKWKKSFLMFLISGKLPKSKNFRFQKHQTKMTEPIKAVFPRYDRTS